MKREIETKKTSSKKVAKETPKKEVKRELKKPVKIAILTIGVILCAILLFIIISKLFKGDDSYKASPTYTESFFIKNNKGNYALFNESGKKKSDFIYDTASNFMNGTALVYKGSDGYAIINEDGKIVVPFGEYNYISSYSGLYKVRSDKGYKLINNKGKTILDAGDIDASSYGEEYPFIVVTTEKEVAVYSYDGKKYVTLKKSKDAKTPRVNRVDEIATIFYNGQNIIFNSKTKKIITKFEDEQHYCVNAKTSDDKVLTLNACASWFESVTKEGHLVSINGKITDLSKKCDSFAVYDDVVLCSTKDGYHFINTSGKKAKLGAKLGTRASFIDDKNYVIKNDKSNKLDLYKDGKKIKSIDASLALSGKVYEDKYLLFIDNGYEYLSKNGKQALKESFKYAANFDKNGLARVSKDGTKYYLINNKGKKVSKDYYYISLYDGYYEVTNKTSSKGLINSKGKEIIPTKYDQITIKKVRDTYYAIAITKDSKYTLYNLDKGKVIKESKDKITLTDHYIKLTGNKASYYTYKDKLIYKEK